MMECGFASLQLDGDRLELALLFVREYGLNGVHVASQAGDREQMPAMAARNVVQATVLACSLVQTDPAGQVGHRLRSRPVGIILMPRHDSTVPRRLAEKLVMPKTDRTVQELRRRYIERRIP